MGKTIKVSEFDLKFGQDDHKVDVYAVFKEKNRSDILAIYSDRNDSDKDTLHYASVHLKNDALVFIDVKDKSEIVKEYTWKLLNSKENENFETIDISKYEKVEIVSSNELLVKSEVIKKLFDLTIPKEESKHEKKKVKNKMSSSSKILLTGFSLAILVAISFVVINKDLILGTNIKYTCTNSYLDTTLGSNKQEIEYLTFNFNDELTTRTMIIRYTFDNKEDYDDYVNEGVYYKYEPTFEKSKVEYKKDDSKFSFDIIEEVVIDEFYNGDNTKDKLINNLTNNNYHCVDVSE